MIVLGLDTTGQHCSVSIVDDAKVLAHISEPIGRGHAERLAPMVQETLIIAGLTSTDITRLAVCTGPGSFTGLRVALSFAKGFALPRQLPIIGIDALGVTYFQNEPEGLSYAIIYRDIRRGEFMFGTYSGRGPLLAIHPTNGSMEDIQKEADLLQLGIIEATTVDTRILAWLAIDADPKRYPDKPLYSRPPDAKLPGGIMPS